MRVILSGGGTGGHIYPALTIAENILRLEPRAEITFVGTREGLESNIVPRYGYPLEFITVAGFRRSLGLSTLKSGFKLVRGLREASALLRKLQPDLVIGTGGYVCGPIVLQAARAGIPCCIQEQNAMPGVTNKILARFVRKVFLGYREGEKYFAGDSEKIFTGNPVRDAVLEGSREEGIREFGLDPDKKTVLVFGGSRGAHSINKASAPMEERFVRRGDIQIIHATGDVEYESYMKTVSDRVKSAEHIKILPYIHNMPLALAAADIAVSRAGAIGLAELMVRGVPSILVPYPYATANHQEFNARALEHQEAAKVILDRELTSEGLQSVIEELLLHTEELEKMHEAALRLGRPQAGEEIARQALTLVKKQGVAK